MCVSEVGFFCSFLTFVSCLYWMRFDSFFVCIKPLCALLLTILRDAPEPSVRANIVIALGDLALRLVYGCFCLPQRKTYDLTRIVYDAFQLSELD